MDDSRPGSRTWVGPPGRSVGRLTRRGCMGQAVLGSVKRGPWGAARKPSVRTLRNPPSWGNADSRGRSPGPYRGKVTPALASAPAGNACTWTWFRSLTATKPCAAICSARCWRESLGADTSSAKPKRC